MMFTLQHCLCFSDQPSRISNKQITDTFVFSQDNVTMRIVSEQENTTIVVLYKPGAQSKVVSCAILGLRKFSVMHSY